MGRISKVCSNVYYRLSGAYHHLKGRMPKPQTVDLGRRNATGWIIFGAAVGATSLGALLSACGKEVAIRPGTMEGKVEIVAENRKDAIKKTRSQYGFFLKCHLYKKDGLARKEGSKWKTIHEEYWEEANVVIDPKRVKNVEFVKRGNFIAPKDRYGFSGMRMCGPKYKETQTRIDGLEELYFKLPQGTADIREGYYKITNLRIEYNDGTILPVTLKIK